ncbi:hypothetical protein ACFLXO_06645 [Chloroflexota bacterium]
MGITSDFTPDEENKGLDMIPLFEQYSLLRERLPYISLGEFPTPVQKLELGYPSSMFYTGEDPWNNTEVMKSLDQAGKLINKLPSPATDKLPHSFKGYELYSWEEDNQWHFTLITGTNRTKTMEEITLKEDFISEAG